MAAAEQAAQAEQEDHHEEAEQHAVVDAVEIPVISSKTASEYSEAKLVGGACWQSDSETSPASRFARELRYKNQYQMNLTVSFFVNGHLRETKQITTPCTIGRSSRANWVLVHPMLSRSHCVLFDENDELYLRDNGSLNGTHFKEAPVSEPVRLQFGDEFTVGYNLKFQISAPDEQGRRPAKKVELTEKTTVVFARDEFTSQQSTILAKEPAV